MPERDLFRRVAALSNLRSAWIKARHYARTEEFYFDAYAYDLFEGRLEANLAALQDELLGGTYEPRPLQQLVIPKADGVRTLYSLDRRDSVAAQAVINVVGPVFEGEFSAFSFGNRLNVGEGESEDAYRRWQDLFDKYESHVRSFLHEGTDSWYLITDIENCYPSIGVDRLRGLLGAQVADDRTMELLDSFLRLEAWDPDERLQPVEGLPPGTIYSHFLANVYFTEFDNVAVQHATRYARYVDDICLVCPDEASLRETERVLAECLGRSRPQQHFKTQKTVRRPVTDWKPLVDHTRKLRYARRLDVMGALDVPASQIQKAADAEAVLHDLYLVVETTGDIERLVRDAGFVIGQLRRLGAPDLDSIIYSLLDAHPLRPSTMRVALSCLLELELPTPSCRFQHYLTPGRDDLGYFRMNLLEVLPFFSESAGGLKDVLIDQFCSDPSYLVRASTYVALKALAECAAISLTVEELDLLRRAETSTYALSRLVDCYTVAEGDGVWIPLVSFLARDGESQATGVARAVSELLRRERADPAILQSVLPTFEQLDGLDCEAFIHLLYATSRFGAPWMLSRVLSMARDQLGEGLCHRLFSILALEVIEDLALHRQLGRLLEFSGFVQREGFTGQASLGLQEVIGRTSDSEVRQRARVGQDAIRRTAVSIGLPDWYANDPECHRQLYRDTHGDAEYLCLGFDSDATGRVGTLELISIARLRESGFSDPDQWVTYLRCLHEQGVICLLDAGAYRENGADKAFSLYEKPAGFDTAARWLQHQNVDGLFPVSVVVQLGLAVLDAVSTAAHASVRVASIDPLNVLWNPRDGTVMLLNIGSSLGIPTYQCGIAGCDEPCSRDEMGPSTSSYHLGLLILQLIRKECPIAAINLTRSRYGRRISLNELVDIEDLSPHMRLILVRLLQKVDEYRYASLSCLHEDLTDALAFSASLAARLSTQDPASLDRETLGDFVAFRLKIVSRNPELRGYPVSPRVRNMLKSLSESLAFLPESMLSEWVPRLGLRPGSPMFPPSYKARNLSPEGRRLLGIAQGWEEALAPKDVSDQDVATLLTMLCLYHTVAVEASSSLAAAVAASSDISAETLAKMKELVQRMMSEVRGTPTVAFSVRVAAGDSIAINAVYSSDDLQQLQQFLSWIEGRQASPYGRGATSLSAVGLFLALFAFECEVLRHGRPIARSLPVVPLKTKGLAAQDLWHLVADFGLLDREITHLDSTSLSNSEHPVGYRGARASEVWTRIPEILRFVRSVNPSRRWAAELYSYEFWADSGIIELTFPHLGERGFRASEVFSSGDFLKKWDSKRPVRVDVLSKRGLRAGTICSVLAPSGHFKRLPVPARWWSPAAAARWMRVHPYLRLLALTAVGLGLPWAGAWVASAVLGIRVPTPIIVLGNGLAAVSLNLLASSIQGFLATRHPEDARLVE